MITLSTDNKDFSFKFTYVLVCHVRSSLRKFLNDIIVTLVQTKLTLKLKGPDSFYIPRMIDNTRFHKTCKLVASVSIMVQIIYKNIDIGELKPTNMSLQLAIVPSNML